VHATRWTLAALAAATLAVACSSTTRLAQPGATAATTTPVTAPATAGSAPSIVTSTTSTSTTTSTTAPPPSTAATVPATSVPATTVPAAAQPATFTIAFGGDALWHSPLWRAAARLYAAEHDGAAGYDFAPMLAGIRPLVEPADLAICHLETPIAPEGERLSTYPRYGVPAEVVPAIAAAGFDRCSTSSNHVLDRGAAGIDRTVAVLEANGLGQSGMARTPEEALPQLFGVAGVTVAHLSYTYGYNGLRPPKGQDWRAALLDPARVVADATAARAMGAQLVVVSLHWGTEGRRAVSGEQRAIANAITASGQVDLIVGHHAHVLQAIEQVNGAWVAFGLGNMISNLAASPGWPDAVQDGAVVTFTVTVGADGGVAIAAPVVHPTWVDPAAGFTVRDVAAGLADPAVTGVLREQLLASLERTRDVLGDYIAG
jgi:poly-gamma-glutamate synthesis protein (capsule biosynthesis protein)